MSKFQRRIKDDSIQAKQNGITKRLGNQVSSRHFRGIRVCIIKLLTKSNFVSLFVSITFDVNAG